MSAELTLIMPTRGRPDRVRRRLDYYAANGLRATLVIADASEPSDASLTAEACKRVQGVLDVRHVPSAESFVQRLAAALEGAETDHVALVGDDDFFLPDALEEASQRLRADASLAAVTGRALTLVPEGDGQSGAPAIRALNWPQARYVGDTPSKRLRSYRGRTATFYVVRRREGAMQAFRRMARSNFDAKRDAVFMEQFDATLVLLAGSIEHMERLLLVRMGGNPSSGGATERQTSYFQRLTDPRWSGRVSELEEIVAAHVPDEVARTYVRDLVGRHVILRLAAELKIHTDLPPMNRQVALSLGDLDLLRPIMEAATDEAHA